MIDQIVGNLSLTLSGNSDFKSSFGELNQADIKVTGNAHARVLSAVKYLTVDASGNGSIELKDVGRVVSQALRGNAELCFWLIDELEYDCG